MTATSADLEISLYRRDAGSFSDGDGVSYGIGLRYSDPESEADKRQDGVAPVHFDPAELRQRALDPAGYGQYLAGQLLAEPADTSLLRSGGGCGGGSEPHRCASAWPINAGAAELHNLRWETLWLPGAPAPLLTGQNISFSRFLGSADWRPVRLRPESDCARWSSWPIRPTPTRFGLSPVNREQELAAARAGLGDISVTELATRGQVTLNNIAAALREGYDVLYLVAHGKLVDGAPWLFLEKEDGDSRTRSGPGPGDAHLPSWRSGRGWPCWSPARAPAPGRSSRPPRITARCPGWARGWPRPACRR